MSEQPQEIDLRALADSDARFYERLELQVNRATHCPNLSEDEKLLAIRRIVDGIVTDLTTKTYKHVPSTPSLPSKLDDDALDYLVIQQRKLVSRGYGGARLRDALEKLKDFALIEQFHREEERQRCKEKIPDVQPSVLPPLNDISLGILAKLDSMLRGSNTPDPVRRKILENAERGILLRQQRERAARNPSVRLEYEL
jgi:hypothetical protein